jgi:hypothetical protein
LKQSTIKAQESEAQKNLEADKEIEAEEQKEPVEAV